jgi:penicillin G amidase
VQDLYLEKFDPANPTRYQTSTGWREALVVNEPIKVRKSLTSTETTTVDHKVVITSNRPIVFTEGEKRFSLRWTALDPATNEFEAFLKINRARDWRSFVSALRSYPGPSMNFVYADKRGNIGYYAAGRIPVRKTGDGSIPYDGASDAGDWASFIPFEKLPTLFNPPSGIIVTANNRVVGTDYPFHLTHEWVPPYRARRIHDLLTVGRKFTVEDFLKIQADTFSYPDHIFAREIERIAVDKSAAEWKEMHDLVKGWDGKANSQSTILPLVVETRRIFTSHLLEPFGKFNWLSQGLLIDEAIKKRPPALLPKGFSSFEELVMTSYREAKKSLEGKLGPDQSRWSWERYSVPVQFPHPLARIPILGSQFVIDPIPAGTGGSNATVNAGANVSMRMVVDLRDMDNTRQGLGTGQSGNPASPHWKDQLKEWSEARPRQFPFSKEAVEAKTKLHTILVRQ